MISEAATLIESLGEWLQGFSWDWYFTGTFATPVTTNGARFLLQKYVRSLQQASRTDANMFWVVERGPEGGNIHAHGLIGNVGTVEPYCGSKLGFCVPACGVHLWHFGKAMVVPYRKEGAAPFYISKNVFLHKGESDSIARGDWDIIGKPIPLENEPAA